MLQKCPARFPAPLAALALLAAGGFYRYEVFQLVNGMGPLWIEKIYVPLAGNIDLFVLGMAINWMVPWATRVTKGLRTLETGLLLLAIFYVLGAWVFTQGSYGPNGPDFLPWAWLAGPTVTAVVTTAVILLMESHVARRQEPTRLARKFVRGTQLAGVLTYAIYVWHEPIFARQGTLYKGGDTVWPSLAAFSVALGLTLLVAYLSYRFIEAPFEQQKVSTPPEALP
jgi:peptidoglycan/LPS O-acetylase OafA/YrhL